MPQTGAAVGRFAARQVLFELPFSGRKRRVIRAGMVKQEPVQQTEDLERIVLESPFPRCCKELLPPVRGRLRFELRLQVFEQEE